MSQSKWKEIAVWLGVNPPYLSRVTSRKMLPSPQKAAELKEVSGISVEDWFYLGKDALRNKLLIAHGVSKGKGK